MKSKNYPQDFGLFVLRGTLGLYLVLAGVGKVQAEINGGLGTFYQGPGYQSLQPKWLPDLLAAPYGYALPWLEVLAGALLIFGLFCRPATIACLLMLVSFTVAKVFKSGNLDAMGPDDVGPFSGNYVQVAGYLLLLLVGCGRWTLDSVVRGKRTKKG